jgi:hypothetical protein
MISLVNATFYGEVTSDALRMLPTGMADNTIYQHIVMGADGADNPFSDEGKVYMMLGEHDGTCGATLVADFNLSSNITSNGTCYTIGANDIIVDCGGNSITGNSSGYGISLSSRTNVTIRNCIIENFTTNINDGGGSTNLTVYNNTLRYPLQSAFYGASSGVNITENTFEYANDSTYAYIDGIITNSYIFNNEFRRGIYGATGIMIKKDNITIELNNFTNITYGFKVIPTVTHKGTNVTLKNNSFNSSQDMEIFTHNSIGCSANGCFTDLSLIDQSIANYSFITSRIFVENTGKGNIRFFNISMAESGSNLSDDLQISTNSIFVNSSRSPGFNESANVTLYGVSGYVSPAPKVAYDDVTYSFCSIPTCYNLSYSGGTFTFNTTHFTSFKAAEFDNEPNTTQIILNSTSAGNYSSDNLTCYASVEDAENLTLNVHYKWFNNSVEVSALAGNKSGVANATLTLIAALDSPNTTRAENWTCSILAEDGLPQNETDWNNASLIIANTPPTQDPPVLNSTYGTDLPSENLTVYPQNVQDADGDPVTNITNWYVNGTSITVLNMPFDTNSASVAKDYSGYDNNGTVNGSNWTSSGIAGGAYAFDGINDHIDSADASSLNLTGAMTIEVWINGTDVNLSGSSTSAVSPTQFQVVGDKEYFVWISSTGNLTTAERDTDGTGWTATNRTNGTYSKTTPQFQVVGSKIYYVWAENDTNTDSQIWTAEMNTDGTGWTATNRTSSAYNKTWPQLHVVGDNIYYVWQEDRSGVYWLWTAEMNVGGTGWSQANKENISQTTAVEPQLQVAGSKIYYAWLEYNATNFNLTTAEMDISGTGWNIINRTSVYKPYDIQFQVVDDTIYYVYGELPPPMAMWGSGILFAQMYVNGSGWNTALVHQDGVYGSQNPQLQIVGDKAHIVLDTSNMGIYSIEIYANGSNRQK